MKILLKITLCLAFVMMFAGFAQAQTKTAKGYFCGYSEGAYAGTLGIKTGIVTKLFDYTWRVFITDTQGMSAKQAALFVKRNTTNFVGDSYPRFAKPGAEFFIQYTKQGWAKSIKLTGKRKKISPCSVE